MCPASLGIHPYKLLKTHYSSYSSSYLYGTELDVCVVVRPPQPAEGPLSLLLSAQREEPPGGAGHEHQQHNHQYSWHLSGHCQPPPRYH